MSTGGFGICFGLKEVFWPGLQTDVDGETGVGVIPEAELGMQAI